MKPRDEDTGSRIQSVEGNLEEAILQIQHHDKLLDKLLEVAATQSSLIEKLNKLNELTNEQMDILNHQITSTNRALNRLEMFVNRLDERCL